MGRSDPKMIGDDVYKLLMEILKNNVFSLVLIKKDYMVFKREQFNSQG